MRVRKLKKYLYERQQERYNKKKTFCQFEKCISRLIFTMGRKTISDKDRPEHNRIHPKSAKRGQRIISPQCR